MINCKNSFLCSSMKTTKVNQQDLWKFQSIITFMVYIPSLICVAALVNYDPNFHYDPGMIFDNHDFNLTFLVVMAMGIISLVLTMIMNNPNADKTL